MKRVVVACGAMLLCGGVSPVDWKLYSVATPDVVPERLFYEKSGIENRGKGILRVWTKAIPTAALDAGSLTSASVHLVGNRAVAGYQPPIIKAKLISAASSAEVIVQEQQADDNDVPFHDQILLDIDCINRVSRTISGSQVKGDKMISAEIHDDEWRHSGPGTSGHSLMILVCAK